MKVSIALLSLVCFLAGGCSRGTQPIVIGAAGPWGEWAGEMTKKGIDLAVDEINAAGGIRGRRLEVLARDDQRDGARAAVVAQELVRTKAVVGVIGHVTSGAMVAAAKVYDGHLAAIATSATSPDLTGISPWTFRVISSDSTNGVEIARFVTAMGRRRAAVVYENDSYGRGLADAFRKSFTGEIVAMDPIGAKVPDAQPYIAYYKAHDVDIVFVVGLPESGFALLREARREGWKADFIGGDGWAGLVADTVLSEGAYVGTAFTAEDPREDVQRFVAAFRARYGVEPEINAALGYDATRVLAQAIAAVGPDRRAIRRYLAHITPETAFHGVTGTIRFRPDGDPVSAPYRITRVHRGAFLLAGASR
ncbi:MAG: ABC transporter substrate-binding protein [Gemmatimonadaceae bacterium]|nr:ABC transporter substrate-binding protein [Gemmatimonadaceae bacterium]